MAPVICKLGGIGKASGAGNSQELIAWMSLISGSSQPGGNAVTHDGLNWYPLRAGDFVNTDESYSLRSNDEPWAYDGRRYIIPKGSVNYKDRIAFMYSPRNIVEKDIPKLGASDYGYKLITNGNGKTLIVPQAELNYNFDYAIINDGSEEAIILNSFNSVGQNLQNVELVAVSYANGYYFILGRRSADYFRSHTTVLISQDCNTFEIIYNSYSVNGQEIVDIGIDVIYANGKYLMGPIYSTDAHTWVNTNRYGNPENVKGGNIIINYTVGGSRIHVSTDNGDTWDSSTVLNAFPYSKILHIRGKFICYTNKGLMYSTDGKTWVFTTLYMYVNGINYQINYFKEGSTNIKLK